MADPTDEIRNTTTHRVTEGTSSVSSAGVTNLETDGAEKVELTNKGPNTVYFRCDGTAPTAQASGNADQLASGATRVIEDANVDDVKMICHTAETATVFHRLYS